MKNRTITIIIISAVVVGLLGYVGVQQKNTSDAKKSFLAHVEQLTQDAKTVESIPLMSIYRNGRYWVHLNAGEANFEEGIYYTNEGYLGNGNSATLEEFLKSTELTNSQAQTLAAIMRKYPFIDGITPDPNVFGTCVYDVNRSCKGIKFYLPPFAFNNGVSTAGFMYVPLDLNERSKEYFEKHFSEIKQISENWYQFSGKH